MSWHQGKGVLLAALLTLACVPEDEAPPCTGDGFCLPGFQCVLGTCLPRMDEMPTGDEICGRGGTRRAGRVTLIVPSGGLRNCVDVMISEVADAPTNIDFRPASRVQRVAPTDTALHLHATIQVGTSSGAIGLWRAPALDGPWLQLPGSASSTIAFGETEGFGFFVAGGAR